MFRSTSAKHIICGKELEVLRNRPDRNVGDIRKKNQVEMVFMSGEKFPVDF